MPGKNLSLPAYFCLLTRCCAALAGLAWPARAAVTEAWVQRYNAVSNAPNVASKVVSDAAGDIIVTGSTQDDITRRDILTVKYSGADGTVIWQKRYNGPANGNDSGEAVAVDGTGNVVVTGSSEWDTDSGSWVKFTEYYTAKYAAADGVLLWQKRSRPNGSDQARAVMVDGSGNVVVTGVFCCSVTNTYIAKYAAADGALLWEKRSIGGGQAVAVDGSGNVVMTGSSASEGSSNSDYYTAKYAQASGALLWEKRYNGLADNEDHAQAVAVDGSGDVVVTGSSYNETNNDYYTAKYASADGALLWEKRYNGPANSDDRARLVAVDSAGNVLVTGTSEDSAPTDNKDCYTVKYAAADGALLWERRYNGPANNHDEPHAMALDGSGNVVVTGSSHNGTNNDYYTAKYAAISGALLWEKRFDGPGNGEDSGQAVAINGSGTVAVTGFSSGDYVTIVYRESLPPISIALVANGIRIRFVGIPGHTYEVQRAVAATGLWSTIATPTAPIGGIIEFIDSNPPISAAFYRTSTQ